MTPAALSIVLFVLAADETPFDKAVALYREGKLDEALVAADAAVAAKPDDGRALMLRGIVRSEKTDFAKAIEDFGTLAKLDPRSTDAFHRRGRDLFKLAKFDESIADFDRVIAIDPTHEPHCWERGLAYWYAGKWKEAVKQFTGYDTVDNLDIENGLWHFLSSAKIDGLEAARKNMIGYKQKKRNPFPALLELYAGRGTEKQVIEAIESESMPTALRMSRFFGHLYIGKWHQAHGRIKESLPHFEKAVENTISVREFASGNFMWHCARIELDRTKAQLKGN